MKLPGLMTEPYQELSSRTHREQSEFAPSFIDRHPIYAFALLTLLFAIAVAALSSFKLLWFDELITLHIARLGTPVAIWSALGHAVDPNPPLIHLAVLACRALFGEHELALRLPAALGYWLGMLSLFLFLKRRVSGTWAMVGTLLSMTNAGFDFSFESRSYGLFYGFTMLAILCWSIAVDFARSGRPQAAALTGMVLALALGISTNYFAVLAVLPIACGEMVRGRRSTDKKLDWRIWIGLALALTPMLAYRPLIQRSVAQFSPFAFNKVSLRQIPSSYFEMVEYVLYPLLTLFSLALVVRVLATWRHRLRLPRWLRRLVDQEELFGRARLLRHEAAAALALMAYPLFGYVLAKAYGGMFSARFILPVCLGFATMGTAIAFRLFGHREYTGSIFLAFLLAWFVARESYVGYTYKEQKQAFYRVVNAFPASYASGPIVVADPLMALTFRHYAPPALANRVVYPIDLADVRSVRGDDSPEENLWAARNTVVNVPLVPLADLQRSSAGYVILAADGNWLVTVLEAHHELVRRLPIETQAGGIGGFTPLAHGLPAFFVASGDRSQNAAPNAPGRTRPRPASTAPGPDLN